MFSLREQRARTTYVVAKPGLNVANLIIKDRSRIYVAECEVTCLRQ